MIFCFEDLICCWEIGSTLQSDDRTYDHTEEDQWVGFPFALKWNDGGGGRSEWISQRYHLQYRLSSEDFQDKETLREIVLILLPED